MFLGLLFLPQVAVALARTGAVLHFGTPLTEGRMDPIVSPGTASQHSHVILGGSNFGLTIEGDQLLGSACTTATINNDKSNYWVPTLWFRSPDNGTFHKVPSYYSKVWYLYAFLCHTPLEI